jgi:hypothetical protein
LLTELLSTHCQPLFLSPTEVPKHSSPSAFAFAITTSALKMIRNTYTVGNAADNFKRNSSSSSLSDQDIKTLRAKFGVKRDPLLMHDPSADVSFEDFIQSPEARRSLETSTNLQSPPSNVWQGLKKAAKSFKKHFSRS